MEARPIFLTDTVVISKSSARWSNSTETWNVSTSALQHLVRQHFRSQIFSLSNLRTIFETVGLLGEKDVAMIVRGLNYFRSSSPVLNIDPKALIWLRTLGSLVDSVGSILNNIWKLRHPIIARHNPHIHVERLLSSSTWTNHPNVSRCSSIITAANLMIQVVHVVNFSSLGCSVGCSKSTEFAGTQQLVLVLKLLLLNGLYNVHVLLQ